MSAVVGLAPGALSSPVVFWRSSNPAVLEVGGTTGVVQALAQGTATVTASAGPRSAEAPITVVGRPSSIEVLPASSTADALGAELAFSATVRDRFGDPIANAPVTWSSSASGILAVLDGQGRFLTSGNGSATVTATSVDVPTVSGSALAVVRQAVDRVTVSPKSVELGANGETAQAAAQPEDRLGNAIDDASVSWASSNPSVATVSPAGLITGVGVGAATVTVTATDPGQAAIVAPDSTTGSATATSTIDVTVVQRIVGLSVTPTSLDLLPGSSAQLTATYLDAVDASVVGPPVTWSSSKGSVASVNGAGLVTAAVPGATTVTATGGGFAGSATVTVRGADLAIDTFSVIPDGSGVIIDLSQVQFDVFIDNLGVSDAPTSTLAVRIVDSGTSSPIQADLQFPVPAIPAGAYHQMLVSGGGQISGGSLAAALTFTAIVDAAGVIAELDESNNTALSSSYPVVGAPAARIHPRLAGWDVRLERGIELVDRFPPPRLRMTRTSSTRACSRSSASRRRSTTSLSNREPRLISPART